MTNSNAALASRKTIGQAIGLIMQRYQIDEDRALQFLIRASSTGNLRLRMVADEVASGASKRLRHSPEP